jgi:predicted DNA-binding transcriptional regulator AlpA
MTATRYLTTEEIAERFRTAPSSVREWRQKGYGPKGTKFGRRVLYAEAEVERWEQERIDAEGRSA